MNYIGSECYKNCYNFKERQKTETITTNQGIAVTYTSFMLEKDKPTWLCKNYETLPGDDDHCIHFKFRPSLEPEVELFD